MVFIVVGGIAVPVNIAGPIALNLPMPYEGPILFAYACGMTVAYVLNKNCVYVASGLDMISAGLYQLSWAQTFLLGIANRMKCDRRAVAVSEFLDG